MAKATPYAHWLNNLAIMRKEANDPDFEGCEEVLAFISIREEIGTTVKVTDLVQSWLFGTGPTVHRKVSVLVERGYLSANLSKVDARAKHLSLTKAGASLLNDEPSKWRSSVSNR